MYFVTGASGRLGQLVAGEVAKQGAAGQTTLGSRDPGKLAGLGSRGFRTAAFDFDDPQSMRDALQDHQHLLLISGDTPTEQRILQHKAAVDAAKAAGIRHVVYTSFTNAGARSKFTFAQAHAETEAHIKASGLAYAFLRNNQYAENIANAVAYAKQSGTYAVYGGQGKVAYIPRADAAFAAATAMLKPGAGQATYEITGSRTYDAVDIAHILGRRWGKPVAAAELPRAALVSALEGARLPGFLVEALVSLHEANAAGELAAVSDDFRRLTGRAPESLEGFLDRTL